MEKEQDDRGLQKTSSRRIFTSYILQSRLSLTLGNAYQSRSRKKHNLEVRIAGVDGEE